MSGGTMNYAFCHINEAAEDVALELQRCRRAIEHKDWSYFDGLDERYKGYLLEEYGNKPEFKDVEALAHGVLRRMYDAYEALRRAAIYAQRVEWLTSGDDGFGSFIGRVDEDLAKLEKEKEKGWDFGEESQ